MFQFETEEELITKQIQIVKKIIIIFKKKTLFSSGQENYEFAIKNLIKTFQTSPTFIFYNKTLGGICNADKNT